MCAEFVGYFIGHGHEKAKSDSDYWRPTAVSDVKLVLVSCGKLEECLLSYSVKLIKNGVLSQQDSGAKTTKNDCLKVTITIFFFLLCRMMSLLGKRNILSAVYFTSALSNNGSNALWALQFVLVCPYRKCKSKQRSET